jgi:hypothetical protein
MRDRYTLIIIIWYAYDLAPYSCAIKHDAGHWEALAHTALAALLALEPSASDQVFAGSRKRANMTVSGRFYWRL